MKHLITIIAVFVMSCSLPVENISTIEQGVYSQTPTGNFAVYQFTGPITGQTVKFGLWLPPQYDGVTPMPVLYWMHGKLANESGAMNQLVPTVSSAISTGKIRPIILVTPWGGSESWWVNACGITWPIEDMVLLELVPHIEANTTAIPDWDSRIIGGFSMGAHGALRAAAKQPGMFRGVFAAAAPKTDPAFVTWTGEATAYQNAFCSSASNFAAEAPLTWYQTNTSDFLTLPISNRFIVGGNDPTLINFQMFKNKVVNNLGIPVSWATVPGVGHQQGATLSGDAGASFQVIESWLP